MKFTKNWKRFWTLSRSRDGFTLVELIVVIAILAILAGVAVPAYSGYVTKANKQADMSLVSEVRHALELQYYADVANAPDYAYVVLTSSGARSDVDGGFADKAMQAAFGDAWKTSLTLSADDWTAQGTAEMVMNSSYLSNGNTADDLLNSVSTLTNLAASAVGDASILVDLLGVDEGIISDLSGYEVGTEEYNNAASNLLVLYVADELANYDPEGEELSTAATWALMYGYVYAYHSGDEEAMNELNNSLKEATVSGSAMDKVDALEAVIGQAMSPEVEEFITSGNDADAFMEIMKAANNFSDSILSSSDITSNTMYTSGAVTSAFNGYVGAMTTISGLNPGESGILITFNPNAENMTDADPQNAKLDS